MDCVPINELHKRNIRKCTLENLNRGHGPEKSKIIVLDFHIYIQQIYYVLCVHKVSKVEKRNIDFDSSNQSGDHGKGFFSSWL